MADERASPQTVGHPDRDERLAAVLETVYECLERGDQPDVEELCAQHADLAEEIRECVASLSFLRTVELVARGEPEPVRELKPGERFGPYEVLGEIGRGGMGIVYRARHVLLDRPVALKVLVSSTAFGVEARRRFFREARTAANLHHTNIVPIFDVGEVDGICYYAMQLIAGCPLNHLIAMLREEKPIWTSSTVAIDERETPLEVRAAPGGAGGQGSDAPSQVGEGGAVQPAWVECVNRHPELAHGPSHPGYFRQVAALIAQVARALAYAHERGVVHRDIKPSNLILDAEGVLWITDFGLAVHLPAGDMDSQVSFELVGTPHYMSPEQVMPGERKPDHRMDIYSLGATLYELVTLRPMVQGKNTLAVLTAIVSETPPPPRRVNPRVPRDLDAIIRKATAKDPDQRYQTAAEFAEDLERFLRYEPTRARPLGVFGRFGRWCQRQPLLATTIGLAVVAMGLTGGIAYRKVQRERDQALAARQVAEQALREAQEARMRAQQRLWESLYQQARATLATRNAGRRAVALSLLQQAAAMNFSPELRDVAVEALALTDLIKRASTSFDGGVTYIGFGPGGSECFVATLALEPTDGGLPGPHGHIYLRCMETGQFKEVSEAPITGLVSQVMRRPDGTLLAIVWERREDREDEERRRPWRDFVPVLWNSLGDRKVLARNGEEPERAELLQGGNSVMAWYRRSGEVVVYRVHSDALEERTVIRVGDCEAVTLGPDFSNQISALASDGTVRIWDLETGEELPPLWDRPIATPGRRLLQWDTRGRLLAVGSAYGTLSVWSRDRDEPLYILSGHRGPITHVAFSPGGEMLATASVADMTLRVWQAYSGEEIVSLRELGAPPTGVVFSPDGRWLLAGSREGRVVAWEVSGTRVVRELTPVIGPFADALYTPEEDRIVVATRQGRVLVVHPRTREILEEHDVPHIRGFRTQVASLAVLADGTICWQSADGSVWQASRDGEAVRLLRPAWKVPFSGRIVRISEDGSYIVRLNRRLIELWRPAERSDRPAAQHRVDEGVFLDLDWQESQCVALWNADKQARLVFFDVDGESLRVDRTIATSLDGARIALLDKGHVLLGTWDGSLHVIGAATGEARQLATREAPVTGIAASPDRRRVAVAYEDGSIEVWNAVPALEIAYRLPREQVGPVASLRFSADGESLLLTGDYLVEWNLSLLDRELRRMTLLPEVR